MFGPVRLSEIAMLVLGRYRDREGARELIVQYRGEGGRGAACQRDVFETFFFTFHIFLRVNRPIYQCRGEGGGGAPCPIVIFLKKMSQVVFNF